MSIELTGAAAVFAWCIAFTPAVARAQTAGLGYAVTGPILVSGLSDRSAAWSVGGGGEAWISGHASVGGEVGLVIFPAEDGGGAAYHYSAPRIQALILSLNGFEHFGVAGSQWRPFVTGGVSVLSARDVGVGLLNVGAGVDLWRGQHVGLRLEVRDQILAAPTLVRPLLLGVRAGILFR